MKIDKNFNKQQVELLKNKNIDIYQNFDKKLLEELEDRIYNIMMDYLDEKQDFTPKAEAFESILDIIVKIENTL